MPDLADAIAASGDTRDHAIQNFRNALFDLMDYKREQGEDVPNITELVIQETVAV